MFCSNPSDIENACKTHPNIPFARKYWKPRKETRIAAFRQSDSCGCGLALSNVLMRIHFFYGEASGIAATDDKFGRLTCVAGVVRTEDGRFTQTVDCRYPTTTTDAAITSRLSGLAAERGCAYEQTSSDAPFYQSPESPEIRVLLDTYAEYAGKPAEAYTIGGGTYARHFERACAFGPNLPDEERPAWAGTEHGPDEAISEESLRQALKVYIVSIARLMELDL